MAVRSDEFSLVANPHDWAREHKFEVYFGCLVPYNLWIALVEMQLEASIQIFVPQVFFSVLRPSDQVPALRDFKLNLVSLACVVCLVQKPRHSLSTRGTSENDLQLVKYSLVLFTERYVQSMLTEPGVYNSDFVVLI